MFGLTFDKLAIIAILATFLIGPERLPLYAGRLAEFARSVRGMADSAKTRMKQEMGPEFNEIEWTKLDPRQYDPRRIVREALAGDTVVVTPVAAEVRVPVPEAQVVAPLRAGSDGRYRRT